MEPATVIENLYAAFARGDIPAVMRDMAPSIAWSEAESNPYQPNGDAFIGPDAILEQLFTRLATEWQEFSVHPASLHEAGSTIVAEGRYTGVHLATGRALDAQFCHIWTVDTNGRVTAFQQYTDTSQLHHVMGISMPDGTVALAKGRGLR